MSVELKTGAFASVIPPELAARKVHDLFHDAEQTLQIIPEASVIQKATEPKIDGKMLLDLLWTVKTFNVKTIWEFKASNGLPSVQFPNGRSGEHTDENVDTFDVSVFEGQDGYLPWVDPSPTTPWTNSPMIAAMKWIKYKENPYPTDLNQARQEVRALVRQYGAVDRYDFFFRRTPVLSYQEQRDLAFENFNNKCQEWFNKTTTLKNAFENDFTVRGRNLYNDFARQLNAIPGIQNFYYDLLLQKIEPIDQQAQSPEITDAQLYQLKQQLLTIDEQIQVHLASEENLEMFFLDGGFKNQIDFFSWNERKLYAGYGYQRIGFNGFPASIIGREPLSDEFTNEAQREKNKHDLTSSVNPYVSGNFVSTATETVAVLIFDGSQNPPVLRNETIDLEQKILFTGLPPSGGLEKTFYLSLDESRCNKSIFLEASGELTGGSANGVSITFNYSSFFDNDGNQKPGPWPPLTYFTEEMIGAPVPEGVGSWNDVIYSGILNYDQGYTPILQYFEQTALRIKQLKNQENSIGEIGKFRFLNESNNLITEVPIFGNQVIFQNVTLEYKINQRWGTTQQA